MTSLLPTVALSLALLLASAPSSPAPAGTPVPAPATTLTPASPPASPTAAAAPMPLEPSAARATPSGAAEAPRSPPGLPGGVAFLEKHCTGCHNAEDRDGGLDLTTLRYEPKDRYNFSSWVKIYERIGSGEMPPGKRKPPPDERRPFLRGLASALTAHERDFAALDGRSTRRRLNTYEYENVLRDLFQAPWLQVKPQLPEDGELHGFNKVGEALDVSHVLVARYMRAAEYAMRQVMGAQLLRPPTVKTRYYARDQGSLLKFPGKLFTPAVERRMFPLMGWQAQPEVRKKEAPITVGDLDPARRELEAIGWVCSYYTAGFKYQWDKFRAPVAGRYRVRFSGYTIWLGPGPDDPPVEERKPEGDRPWRSRKHLPNFDDISRGRRTEPIAVYTRNGVGNRRVGEFDLTPEPQVHDIGEVWLLANETLTPDATRFYRSRPGPFQNPLMQEDGAPGVAFRWMEVEGPLYDGPSFPGYALLFGDLPIRERPADERTGRGASPKDPIDRIAFEVLPRDPARDAERLMRGFLARAYRRPASEEDVKLFLGLVEERLKAGNGFTEAMLAGYTAVLASPAFVFVDDRPGRLDDHALATRLALFLWNSEPDAALRARAARGELRRPEVLRAETERLLSDPRSRRFVEAFLDYWVDTRKVEATAPSPTLYNDYDLDDSLREAALAETQLFFEDLVKRDLPARNLIDSDYTFLNERLATHYGIPGVSGIAMRKVKLPADSPRGGLMTQAMILKVTANGTTTSPVLRGKWITERLLGETVPPPPPVPAVEPDIRGAATIREQLAKHREDPSCAGCHAVIDPPGFALESFDIFGGWRDRYRAVAENVPPVVGRGKSGLPFAFHYAQPVDSSGELKDGRRFKDVREFKRLVMEEEPQVARNLAERLVVYATGAPARFVDRPIVDGIMRRAKARRYGVRTMIHEIVGSPLFLDK
jgi:hypothetical protein